MFTRTSRNHVETKPRFRLTFEEGAICAICGDAYPQRRADLGYDHCLSCSSEKPKIANMALHKQGYTFTSSVENINENQYGAHK